MAIDGNYFAHGWIGVDLDGTLAHYDCWRGWHHIGEPVWAMIERVRDWIREGRDVRIFTARVAPSSLKESAIERSTMVHHIQLWTREHIGVTLEVTHEKDRFMVQLWDDRCVQVEPNTGRVLSQES